MAKKSRVRRTAQLWQVWVRSAAGNGLHWLAYVSPDWKKAAAEYVASRNDYVEVELRTPLGRIVRSYDDTRVSVPDVADWLDNYGIPVEDFYAAVQENN